MAEMTATGEDHGHIVFVAGGHCLVVSFRAAGLDPQFYAERRLSYDEVLPWDLIDVGIDRDFLVREHRRSLAGETTADCRPGACEGCGVCPSFGVEPRLAKAEVPSLNVRIHD